MSLHWVDVAFAGNTTSTAPRDTEHSHRKQQRDEPHRKQEQQQHRRRYYIRYLLAFLALLVALCGVVTGGLCASNRCGKPTPNDADSAGPTSKEDRTFAATAPSPYTFYTTLQLYQAVDVHLQHPERARQQYGPLPDWNVAHLQDFSYVFASERQPLAATFNGNVSQWDVSNAVTLYAMVRTTLLYVPLFLLAS